MSGTRTRLPATRTVADYPTPRWTPRELLVPARAGLRLAGPSGARRLQQEWAGVGTTPPALRSLRLLTGSATDQMAMGFARVFGMASLSAQLPRIEEEASAAIAYYRRRGWLSKPRNFHRDPEPANPSVTARSALGAHWQILQWESGYMPYPKEPGAERWAGYGRNAVAVARVLRHRRPAPWVVLLHGAFMGWLPTDARMFDAVRLHRELGFNVAMPVMPLHGPRRPEGGVVPRSLPSLDAMDNVHGLSQGVYDIRALLGWIRTRSDEPIAVYGVSLGGYMTALVGALEEPLACLIAGLPAVDFPEVFRSQTPERIRRMPWFDRFVSVLRDTHRVVSPAMATPATPPERRFIYAGRGDRILRPLQQAAALWQLWERPSIYWFDGGHVAHVRSPDIRRYVDEALSTANLREG